MIPEGNRTENRVCFQKEVFTEKLNKTNCNVVVDFNN